MQDEAGLELYDFHARQYDPLLGRFTSLDPQNQFASGYVGMGNNPVNMIDPDGQFAGALVGKFASGVANAMFGGALAGAQMAHQSGGNLWQGAAQGAFTSGISASLGAFAPSGALGAVYNAGVSALAGSAISGSFSGFGQSALASLPGAFMYGAVGNIDQSITASREQALTNSWSPPKGDYILLPEVTIQDARRGSFFTGWGNAHRWLHSNPTMRSLHGASRLWQTMDILANRFSANGGLPDNYDHAAIPEAATFVSPAGAARSAYSVYRGVDAMGKVRYVGLTSRAPQVRFGEHLGSLGTGKEFLDYRVVNGATGLSRTGARVWEQRLINQYGLGKDGGQLLNKINSISPKKWHLYGL